MSAKPVRCFAGAAHVVPAIAPHAGNATAIPDAYLPSDAVVEKVRSAIETAMNEHGPVAFTRVALSAYTAALAAIRQEGEG